MLNTKPVDWKDCGKTLFKRRTSINRAEILFPKIEDEIIEEQIEKLGNQNTENVKIVMN